LHDIQTLDKRGGFAPALVHVPHPIQNRTTGELKKIAGQSFAAILSLIINNDS